MLEKNLPPDAIRRDPTGFAADQYDLIVVGGGIYGVMLSLESARRGLTCLLLERDDFGAHTSFNHLRILHGGLRYLQHLDLKRFRDSVSERSWFLRHFPHLTRPITCLMPLSGRGFYRPAVLNMALSLDNMLAFDRNHQIPRSHRIDKGKICTPAEARQVFPALGSDAVGAALWQDGFVTDPPRLLIELLRWACAYGSRALNYCPAKKLKVEKGCVVGVDALDRVSGARVSFRSSLVINAAGPWCRSIARMWDRDVPEIFPHRILVWNLLVDRPPVSTSAVAVSAPGGKHTYFVVPWQGRTLVGTGHKLLESDEHRQPADHELSEMLNDINAALPDLNLEMTDLKKVYWGVMPGDEHCQLGKRPVIHDHGEASGPAGFLSVSGVKFTTARRVADDTLRRMFPNDSPRAYGDGFRPSAPSNNRWSLLSCDDQRAWQALFMEEAVTSLSDAILRRSDRFSSIEWKQEKLAELIGLLPGKGEIFQRTANSVHEELTHLFTSMTGREEDPSL